MARSTARPTRTWPSPKMASHDGPNHFMHPRQSCKRYHSESADTLTSCCSKCFHGTSAPSGGAIPKLSTNFAAPCLSSWISMSWKSGPLCRLIYPNGKANRISILCLSQSESAICSNPFSRRNGTSRSRKIPRRNSRFTTVLPILLACCRRNSYSHANPQVSSHPANPGIAPAFNMISVAQSRLSGALSRREGRRPEF